MPKIIITELTDENRPAMLELALSMYLGETCPYCLKKFEVLDDLKDSVWNGYTDYGRIAHHNCFFAAHPEVKPTEPTP